MGLIEVELVSVGQYFFSVREMLGEESTCLPHPAPRDFPFTLAMALSISKAGNGWVNLMSESSYAPSH